MKIEQRTVAIVDDCSEDREIFCRYLLADRKYDYTFVEGKSGAEGLELCKTVKPDIILLNCLLPDMDGLELIDELKKHIGLKEIPVVMLTGEGNEEIAEKSIQSGAKEYLIKRNLTPKRLHITVENAIERVRIALELKQSQRHLNLITTTALRIHQSLNLEEILNTTVAEVQQFMNCTEVAIYQFDTDMSIKLAASSVSSVFCRPQQEIILKSFQGKSGAHREADLEEIAPRAPATVAHIYGTKLTIDYFTVIEQFKLKSNLVVPILLKIDKKETCPTLWGLLIADDRGGKQQWHNSQKQLLDELAVQLAIAIGQAELHKHLAIVNKRIENLASVDSLTGLANRRHFDEYLQRELRRSAREQKPLSAILIDVDFFQFYNDYYGHEAGDNCLQLVAKAIEKALKRPGDLLARYGGEKFAVILPNTDAAGALKVAEKIHGLLKAMRLRHEESPIGKYLTQSIGVASLLPGTTATPAMLIDAADKALTRAKELGRDRVQVCRVDFSTQCQRLGVEKSWIRQLRDALEENRFCLYTQPIKPLKVGEESHFHEVLLRYLDRRGQIIPFNGFLSIAESHNLMPRIDRWVIRTLCTYLAESKSLWSQQCSFAVNLSGASINDDQFLEFLQEQLSIFNLPPEIFCFEVTETVAISNILKASEFIQSLKALGCRFALDDFGSGMSSLAYLRNLPVDYLKIDGSFVKDIAADPVAKSMVETIHRLGKIMNLKTIAEFVETEEILNILSECGVDYVQGYYFGKCSPLARI